jgi:hypothetical protein
MADWACARRKGYIPGAQRTVFGIADHIRRVRKQSDIIQRPATGVEGQGNAGSPDQT